MKGMEHLCTKRVMHDKQFSRKLCIHTYTLYIQIRQGEQSDLLTERSIS